VWSGLWRKNASFSGKDKAVEFVLKNAVLFSILQPPIGTGLRGSREISMDTRIGFVGLGIMGSAMAERLERSGYALAVYSRTREHTTAFVRRNAVLGENPASVARSCGVVLSMISNSAVLEEISLGTEGILSGLPARGIHVDMSTVSPEVTERLEGVYAERSRFFLHCPVLGSAPQAAEGSLLLFAGGADDPFRAVEPILAKLGRRIWRFDHPAQASMLKLVCNSFIAGTVTTLAQALVVARASGLRGETVLEIVGQSAFNSPMIQAKGASILARNFAPRFFAEHMLKDISLLLDSAASLDCHLPALEASKRLYERAVAEGLGQEDYSTLIKILEKEATLPPP